jgi:hypothetical protein
MMGGSAWAYDLNYVIATEKVKDCDLIVLGDSLVSHGVAVNVIEEQTGLKGYNLSIAGAQAPGTYYLFRQLLESGARPKYLIVDFFPKLLDTDPWFNVENLPSIANYRDCVELAYHARDSNLLASLLLRRTFASVKSREWLRQIILEKLNGIDLHHAENRLASMRNNEINRGLLIGPDRRSISMNMDDYVAYLFSSFQCSSLNRTYVDKLMRLAAAHQVKVLVVLPPYMPSLQAKLDASGFDAKYQEFMKSLVASYPGVRVVDARRSNYDDNSFIDGNHLSYEGALTFSAELGDLLARDLKADSPASPRWVMVPQYRKRAVKTRHETIEESQMAVLKAARY